MSQSFVLGYPRIGKQRELKKILEKHWKGQTDWEEVVRVADQIIQENHKSQISAGLSGVVCNDFSYYDHMLDTAVMFGVIPERFQHLKDEPVRQYFAMARGLHCPEKGYLEACEMTKWFDTNYHYLVPEFTQEMTFQLFPDKILREVRQVKKLRADPLPVLPGPVSFLFLGKEKGVFDTGKSRMNLLPGLIRQYQALFKKLAGLGVKRVLVEEPVLSLDLTDEIRAFFRQAYARFDKEEPGLKLHLCPGYGQLKDNLQLYCMLPVSGLHFNLVQGALDFCQLPSDVRKFLEAKEISLGLVDGQNIWRNNKDHSERVIRFFRQFVPGQQLFLASSVSLLHVPVSLKQERDLPGGLLEKLAFGEEKLEEVSQLASLCQGELPAGCDYPVLRALDGSASPLCKGHFGRKSPYDTRQSSQKLRFGLPEFPTTTIGSFPQTPEVRKARQQYRQGDMPEETYEEFIRNEIKKAVKIQEDCSLDVLVHGEFERNDMVEYFAGLLDGFAVTANGWVQSYGTRCVKPPLICGDVRRSRPLSVGWTGYAQTLTKKPVKGMLTGPVTMLKWSFPRCDMSREETAFQIALALKEEVMELEKAGIGIIQIDEPAFREGMPLRKSESEAYFRWATNSFRLVCEEVSNSTQIHTHMCYSEFNEIMDAVAHLDADVISVETSRSHGELLSSFGEFRYPNAIGPGVYDIHSPAIPSEDQMLSVMKKALEVIPAERLWLNPDCGLKTRQWEEVLPALRQMVAVADKLRHTEGGKAG